MTQKKHFMTGNQNASKGHGAHLRMRCKPKDKAAWMEKSRRENIDLTAWVAQTLNAALNKKEAAK